jgi:hypothetical protein
MTVLLDRPKPAPLIIPRGDLAVPTSELLLGRDAPRVLVTPDGKPRWVSKGKGRPFAGGGAVTASGLYYLSFRDMFQNDSAIDVLADTIKVSLITNSATPNFDTDAGYTASNEVSGTGYTAGGNAVTTDTITVSSGTLIYDGDDVSWTTATFSAARAARGYDDTITTPTADPLLWLTNFGADFAVSAGTFTIQWAAGGIWAIDLTP